MRRHRLFEASALLFGTCCPADESTRPYLIVYGSAVEERGKQIGRTAKGGPMMRRKRLAVDAGRLAMGIDWDMSRKELSQAIPPAFTEYLGKQLLRYLES